jgi:hypothetical protein
MLKNIIIIFFAINAIFWSLFPHHIHCDIAKMFVSVCPAHNVHLIIGLLSFLIAFVIAQYDHLKTMI